jgi:VWFA-related protein
MVPVDVRVLDPEGNPVTDLSAGDFTVLENGERREIAHFSTQAYTALSPDRDGQAVLRHGPGLQATPLTHRTFLIVLGRGRLQEPAKGLDAAIDFVRTKLFPQDQVAVIAYWRATTFTTDKESIVRLLERYRERHGSIEARLDHWFNDMQMKYGSLEFPRGIRDEIDALFNAPDLPALFEPPAVPTQGNGPLNRRWRRYLARLDPSQYRLSASSQMMYAGIEYLRLLEGEKHLIYFTVAGLSFYVGRPGFGPEARAADARVTLSIVHTAGVPLSWHRADLRARGPRDRPIPPSLESRSFRQLWSMADAQAIAEHTGGISSFYEYADKSLGRLDRATRFHYVIGYYPANRASDGRYRTISLKVNRPDVTLLYRHGYYAEQELIPVDDRPEVAVYERMMATAGSSSEIRDIRLSLSVRTLASDEVEVELRIDPSRITFTEYDGHRVARLEVAVFAGDGNQKLIGEAWESIYLKLDADAYARILREGVVHSLVIQLSGQPRHFKGVVYDYEADRLGTANRQLR